MDCCSYAFSPIHIHICISLTTQCLEASKGCHLNVYIGYPDASLSYSNSESLKLHEVSGCHMVSIGHD